MHSIVLSRQENNVGVIPPPPGVSPNFVNPPSLQYVVLNTNIILVIISAIFVVLRLYTTGFILRSPGIDDYMVVLAWLLACASSSVQYLLTRYGLGLHLWDVPFSTYNINFLKFGIICQTLYSLSIMFSKLSILVLFLRYLPHKPKKAIYATITVVVLYTLILSTEWLFACRPIDKYWDLRITRGSCIDRLKFTIVSGVMNTATDAIILLLPIFAVQKMRLPKWEKIGVVVALMTGGFVLIISIIRLKTTVDMASSPDITWEFVRSGIWWMVEMHIAIVCARLPSGRAFLRKHSSLIGYNFNTLG